MTVLKGKDIPGWVYVCQVNRGLTGMLMTITSGREEDGVGEGLVYSICLFPWCKYSHYSQFQVTNHLLSCKIPENFDNWLLQMGRSLPHHITAFCTLKPSSKHRKEQSRQDLELSV